MKLNLTERDGLKQQGRLTRYLRWLSPSLVAMAVVVLFSAAAPAAKADSLDFSLSISGQTVDFSLPSMPSGIIDLGATSVGDGFVIDTVPVTINNGGSAIDYTAVFMNGPNDGGGFYLSDSSFTNYLFYLGGPQLYTGVETDPTFDTGTFSLTSSAGIFQGPATLTISPADPSVPTPEPSSLLLLGSGLLGLSGLIAYKQKKASQVSVGEASPADATV